MAIVVFSAFTIARTKNRTRAMNLEIVLMYSIGIIGFSGISNFVLHAFFGDMIAATLLVHYAIYIRATREPAGTVRIQPLSTRKRR